MCCRDSETAQWCQRYTPTHQAVPDKTSRLYRQQRRDGKAYVAGGIDERGFRDQVDAVGYTAAPIEQFQNLDRTPDPEGGEVWRYYWRGNIPADATIRWQTGTSTCDSASRTWGDTVAECVIDKLCPSHTVVVFAYPEGKENAQN